MFASTFEMLEIMVYYSFRLLCVFLIGEWSGFFCIYQF